MKYYIGVDGGGTKTAYVVGNKLNEILYRTETEGSSYRESSISIVLNRIRKTIDICTTNCNIKVSDVAGIVIGLPCYGESVKDDAEIHAIMNQLFSNIPFHLVNDVEVGWAGSLGLKDGVNIVAGTGSIAFGRNSSKVTARSGGWSTFFSDEGSCYWLGRRTMEFFGKEADGRLEKGPLYNIIMNHYKIDNEFEFIDIAERDIIPYRDKVAQLQRLLLSAAQEQDVNAINLYDEACNELYLIVKSVVEQLNLTSTHFNWSYSGGLFHAKQFVLPKLESMIKELGGELIEPQMTPAEGAFCLAKERFI